MATTFRALRAPNGARRSPSTWTLGPFRLLPALAALSLFLPAAARADDPPPPATLHEIWLPARELSAVLARHPNAVLLSREQLDALLRDARRQPAPENEPPARASITGAHFDARLVPGGGAAGGVQARVVAQFTLAVLSDHWAEVPLGLDGIALGAVEFDGQAVLQTPDVALPQGKASAVVPFRPPSAAAVLVRGRGPRRLQIEFLLPVSVDAGGQHRLVLPRPLAGAADFTLHLPAGARVESPLAFTVQPEQATGATGPATLSAVRAVLPANRTAETWLAWRNPPPAGDSESAALLQDGLADYRIDEIGVLARVELRWQSHLGPLPAAITLALPAEARAVRVEGSDARGWTQEAGGAVRIELAPDAGEPRREAAVTLHFHLPVELTAAGAAPAVALPLVEAAGVHRATGRLLIRHGRGVQVRQLNAGPAAHQRAGLFKAAVESAPDFVAGFALADLPAGRQGLPPPAATVSIQKIAARFSVDADARVEVKKDVVDIERTLTFHVEEGQVFTARVALPPGEELLSVRRADGADADWRAGAELGAIILNWNAGLAAGGAGEIVKIRSRVEQPPETTPPAAAAKPDAAPPRRFTLGNVAVRGAERLTGYLALSADPALRLMVEAEDKLERRDGRTTPVRGEMAWFYRENFRLTVRVERRAAEAEARFTGYALPLAGAVEINGQFDYQFRFSGVDRVRVRVPKETASAFYFSGEHIAERKLEGDTWTIRFQRELTGAYALGVKATLPVQPAPGGDAARFGFTFPTLTPLDVARWSGQWAIEANTDTEIRFAAKGLAEVDSLQAPALAGYRPRHRVIGVFEFIGGQDYTLSLDGARHPAAGMTTAVVDALDLTSVVSASGAARHHATIQARAAGDQFFTVRLPAGAALWSLLLDGELIKPVGGPAGELRVPLPASGSGGQPAAASKIEIIYETHDGGGVWGSAGSRAVAAPQFDAGVPVLKSQWRLWLPEGFAYRKFDSALALETATPEPLLLPRLMRKVSVLALDLVPFPRPVFGSVRKRGSMTARDAVRTLAPYPTPAAAAPQYETRSKEAAQRAAEIRQLLLIAQDYFDQGRYDLAKEQCKDILALDPANLAARQLEEKIAAARATHEPQAQNEARAGALMQTEIRLPPGFLDSSLDARTFLEASGVIFPPGASASYDPANGRLVMRNTRENIELVQALVQAQTAPPAPANQAPAADKAAGGGLIESDIPLPPEFFGAARPNADITGVGAITRMDAKSSLEALGINFPPGTSVTYVPSTGRLLVRNTPENVARLKALVQAQTPPPAQTVVGLLPLRLELPDNGQKFEFAGTGAPGGIGFQYLDDRSRARWAWAWFALGGLAFLALAALRGRGGMMLWLWGALVWTGVPLVVSPALTGACNALAAGWLLAGMFRVLWRWAGRRRRPAAVSETREPMPKEGAVSP